MSLRVLKGKIDNDETVRINLFDGDYTTGYRILRFDISPSNWAVDPDVFAVVATEDMGSSPAYDARSWDWSSNTEKAWAAHSWNGGGQTGYYFARHVDDIIIEDLFIHTVSPPTGQATNYILVLEKIKTSSSRTALARVQNMSQG